MANKWTDDQLEAINSCDKATIVSAAAGSGKTAVLVERTIRMLTDESLGIEADKLLAVTFTNDAANQMKEKLSAAMSKILEENPENKWVAKQQELLSMATICTIDSFCLDLVKNNINELDVSPNFTMLDDEENKILIQKAFSQAAEYFYKEMPDKMKILMDNFAEEDDKEVIKYATELMRFKESLPFPEKWREAMEENLLEIIAQYKVDSQKEFLSYARKLARCSIDIRYYSKKAGVWKKYAPISHTIKKIALTLADGQINVFNMINSPWFKKATAVKFPVKPRANKDDAEKTLCYEAINDRKNRVKELYKQLAKYQSFTFEMLVEMMNDTRRIFRVLWAFVKIAELYLDELKLEKNKLYFSDVTKLTIELLAKETEDGFEKTDLAKRITDEKRYKIILIDEFQDVNNLQDVIFKCISDNDNTTVLGKNVFVVGDMKQSIYRFRQSNPDIFLKTRNMASMTDYADVSKAIYLKKNFRSRKNILDFTNFVFENVMSEKVGEIEYDENERLEYGAPYDDFEFDTDIMLLSGDDTAVDDESENENYDVHFECKAVAEKVKEMLRQKIPVFENGKSRNCQPGDFCVLLRTGKMVNDYIKAFEAVGITAVGDSVKGYLGAREISLALSILKIIDNPMQDIPLVAVSLSPVFGFTPDDMAKIRLVDKYKKFYQLFLAISRDERVKEYGFEPVDIGDEAITKKCFEAVKIISKLRYYASGMTLEKLVRKVYDVTDLMSVAASFENSQQKRANLRLLVKLAGDYESSTGGGLSDFLRYLDRVSESGNDFDEAITVSAGADTVSIKTIHKSKGLEYPFVIVGDMAREYNIPKRVEKLVLNEKCGFGMTLRNYLPKCNSQTPVYDFVYEQNVLEQKSEELRILYVALTRAKEKLILPLYLKTNGQRRIKKLALQLGEVKKLTPEAVGNLCSYSEIITAALLVHPQRDEIFKILKIDCSPYVPCGNNPKLNVEEVFVGNFEVIDKKKKIKASVDNILLDKISTNLAFLEKDTDYYTVAKMSVTEFVREIQEGSGDKEITYFPPVPDVSNLERKATAAEKGTDTHLFMELCDFDKACENPENELKRLVETNRMTEKQAENVDLKTVSAFFDSKIFELCKNSKNVMREKQFKVKLSDMKLDNTPLCDYNDKDVLVQGIADLIIETDDGLVIVDYKTDNVKTDEELVSRHFVQLLLYKLAFELVVGKKVEGCYIYSFKLMRPIKIDFENTKKSFKNPLTNE